MTYDLTSSTDVVELIASAELPLLLDFGADWCPPCHALDPILDEIAAEHPDTIVIRKVDVDRVPDLVVRFGIASAPTMLLFVDGELESKIVGARPKAALLEMLSDVL
jgi:thioredoxin 1